MGTKEDRLSGRRDTHVIEFSDGAKMIFRRRFEDVEEYDRRALGVSERLLVSLY